MTTFATLQSALADEVHEPNDSTIVGRAIVSALKAHRSKELPWSSESSSFTTVSGVDTYPRGQFVTADAMNITMVQVVESSLYTEVIQVSRNEMNRMKDQNAASPTGTATHWCWHDESMILYPTPSSALTIRFDYWKDPLRDEETGAEMTSSSTTETNEMFRRGEVLLRAAAGYHYCLTRTGDDQQATRFKVIYDEAWRSLVVELNIMKMKPGVRGYF
jgi:hypothetical protein